MHFLILFYVGCDVEELITKVGANNRGGGSASSRPLTANVIYCSQKPPYICSCVKCSVGMSAFRVIRHGVLRRVRRRSRSVEQRLLLSEVGRSRRAVLLRRRAPALLLYHLTASSSAQPTAAAAASSTALSSSAATGSAR